MFDAGKNLVKCNLFLLLLAVGSAHAESATVKIDDLLRSEAVATSATVGNVTANTKVEIVERKGFWAKIMQGSNQGWVKLTTLSMDPGTSTGGASALTGLASGRIGGGNIVSASGTRGLSSEDLKTAKPDMTALAAIKSNAVTGEAAQKFGQQAGLISRQIKYLELPKATTGNNTF